VRSTFEIRVHDTRVATLHTDEGADWVTDWDPAWVDMNPRPVVSLKLLDLRLNRPRSWGRRLPPFLTNLLPEARTELRHRLARTHDFHADDDIAFLSLLGGDLSGAIRALPTHPAPPPRRTRPPPEDAALSGYRASLGGMQLKFSVHRRDQSPSPPTAS
jgi:HipA-like protein